MNAIRTTYRRLLQGYDYPKKRYLYRDFSLEERLTGIIGAGGTGKTTLLIQPTINQKVEPLSFIEFSS